MRNKGYSLMNVRQQFDMTLPTPLLYTYRRCPYAMRARMALLWAGVAFDAFEITLRDKPSAMLTASPKGTVPVLVLPDGKVLEESWDIVEWALSQASIGTDAREAWRLAQTPDNQQLLSVNDSDFKHHLDRYKYPERLNKKKDSTDVRQDRQAHRDQAVRAARAPSTEINPHRFFGWHTSLCNGYRYLSVC